MFTCFIRYQINEGQTDEFREYARTWISLIEKFGGKHHGYFVPGGHNDNFPEAKFSFPGLGVEGPSNIAVALFSFQSVEAYEVYRRDVVHDPECKRMTARFNANMSFSKYERNFLIPIFE